MQFKKYLNSSNRKLRENKIVKINTIRITARLIKNFDLCFTSVQISPITVTKIIVAIMQVTREAFI